MRPACADLTLSSSVPNSLLACLLDRLRDFSKDSPLLPLIPVCLGVITSTLVLLQIYVQDHTTPLNFLPYQLFEAAITCFPQVLIYWTFFTNNFPASAFPYWKSIAIMLPLKLISRVSTSLEFPYMLSVILAFVYCSSTVMVCFVFPTIR